MPRWGTIIRWMGLVVSVGACGTPPSDAECDAIKARWQQSYDDWVADNATCGAPSECRVLLAPCGTDLGGCRVAVNLGASQQDVRDIEQGFVDEMEMTGCTVMQNACDCQEEETVGCGPDGTCEIVH